MRPILTCSELPVPGETCERPDVDGKEEVEVSDSTELAKDVAAIANGHGGNLLIGIGTEGSVFAALKPLTTERASAIQKAYENAVRDLCRPTPFVAPLQLKVEGGVVLVLYVAASAGGPIGVSLRRAPREPADNTKKNGKIQHSWVFPIRAVSQTRYLEPDQFATFDPVTRRAFAHLRTIPRESWNQIVVWANEVDGSNDLYFEKRAAKITSIDEAENCVALEVCIGKTKTSYPLSIPGDWVDAVWRDAAAQWQISLRCMLRASGHELAAIPMSAGPQRTGR